jgi:hypothetical protein
LPGDDFNFEKIAKLVGLSSETHQKIKFGGVVGRLTLLAVAGVVAIGYATAHTSPIGALIGIVAIVFIILCVVGLALYVVKTRPELAILEGTQVLRYRQLTIGAKGYSPDASLPPVPDPGLPKLPPDEGGVEK